MSNDCGQNLKCPPLGCSQSEKRPWDLYRMGPKLVEVAHQGWAFGGQNLVPGSSALLCFLIYHNVKGFYHALTLPKTLPCSLYCGMLKFPETNQQNICPPFQTILVKYFNHCDIKQQRRKTDTREIRVIAVIPLTMLFIRLQGTQKDLEMRTGEALE